MYIRKCVYILADGYAVSTSRSTFVAIGVLCPRQGLRGGCIWAALWADGASPGVVSQQREIGDIFVDLGFVTTGDEGDLDVATMPRSKPRFRWLSDSFPATRLQLTGGKSSSASSSSAEPGGARNSLACRAG